MFSFAIIYCIGKQFKIKHDLQNAFGVITTEILTQKNKIMHYLIQ